jgi:hypothetical protein
MLAIHLIILFFVIVYVSCTSRTGLYSSYHCTAGSQVLKDINFTNPESILPENRLCLLKNLCWINDRFVYYQDPIEQMQFSNSNISDKFYGKM